MSPDLLAMHLAIVTICQKVHTQCKEIRNISYSVRANTKQKNVPDSCLFFSGSYSRVTMQLVLTRKITYHLFRTYLPSGLFVVIGWFSLFIPLDHVPGR